MRTSIPSLRIRASPVPPTIEYVGTASGGATNAQNTFVRIRGFNLVLATAPASGVLWGGAASFSRGQIPTSFNGVSVTVNGKPAFVEFYCGVVTSPVCALDQINILTPLDNTVGSVQVVVTNGSVSSAPFTVTMQQTSPTLLLFNLTGPIVATHLNYTLLGSPALYRGASTPAAPGEQIVLYAVGFGLPTTPLTNGSSAQSGAMPYAPVCQVGGANASASLALVGAGLYQINLNIPTTALSGNNAVMCTYSGVATQAGAFVTVQQ